MSLIAFFLKIFFKTRHFANLAVRSLHDIKQRFTDLIALFPRPET